MPFEHEGNTKGMRHPSFGAQAFLYLRLALPIIGGIPLYPHYSYRPNKENTLSWFQMGSRQKRESTNIGMKSDASKVPDPNAVLDQFNVLMMELLRRCPYRGTFRSWEIDLLLDIESCKLRGSSKRKALLGYQKAVQAELEKGAHLPMRFSEYWSGK